MSDLGGEGAGGGEHVYKSNKILKPSKLTSKQTPPLACPELSHTCLQERRKKMLQEGLVEQLEDEAAQYQEQVKKKKKKKGGLVVDEATQVQEQQDQEK